jgi:hypothetical protein
MVWTAASKSDASCSLSGTPKPSAAAHRAGAHGSKPSHIPGDNLIFQSRFVLKELKKYCGRVIKGIRK